MIDLMIMKCLTMWLFISCFAFFILASDKLISKDWIVATLIINFVLTFLSMIFWSLFHKEIMGFLS